MMNEFVYLLCKHWTYSNKYLGKLSGTSKRIPYKVHWVWLAKDSSVISYDLSKFKKYMGTWISRLPNCEFYLWTDIFDIKLPKFTKEIQIMNIGTESGNLWFPDSSSLWNIVKSHKINVGIRSDILRQMILYKHGGLYVDVNDMECLAPFEPLFNSYEYICGVEPMLYCNNAIIGAIPKHIITKKFLKYIRKNIDEIRKMDTQNMEFEELDNWVIGTTGPKIYSEIIFGVLDNGETESSQRILIGPSSMFYSNYECKKSSTHWLTPVSMSAHYDGRTFVK